MSMGKAAALAFQTLESALTPHSHKSGDSDATLAGLPAESALFVTWTKQANLRGCIGTFTPLPLAEGIREYALLAAFKDTRFKPISVDELPYLEVAITLLGPLEAIEDPLDWTLGKHGVKALFPGSKTSTFLPDVAAEQGWTKQETLVELAYKAGVENTEGIKMYRYEGRKVKLAYKEFKQGNSKAA